MTATIRVLRLEFGDRATPFDGEYVAHYDPTTPSTAPDGVPMSATLVTTPRRDLAKLFGDADEALEYWRLPSGRRRPDGKPDRPLTAFTVAVEDL